MKNILVTWATWFLWSHMWVWLLEHWYNVVWIDTCERSSENTIRNIKAITWEEVVFYKYSISDSNKLLTLLIDHEIEWVIHFAWYKAVWESCDEWLLYYENNVSWTVRLLQCMEKAWVKNIIFSSSATVYNSAYPAPFDEKSPIWEPTNPYWSTKFLVEQILDTYCKWSDLSAISLRYFNPVWAHSSQKIWEDIRYSNKSLIAYVMNTLLGKREILSVFWWDRDTPDWSCIRDFISVNDLVLWHIAALEYSKSQSGWWSHDKINLWTGHWLSVLEFIEIVRSATQQPLEYKIDKRRQWDIWVVYANVDKAKRLLKREATDSLEDAIRAQWSYVRSLPS